MNRRLIVSHAGTNRSPAVVAQCRARHRFFSARFQIGSLPRVLTAAHLQSTTQPHLRESNGRRPRRRGSNCLTQRSARRKTERTACVLRSREFTKSQQERIMKYLLLIAAMMALTSATTISSSDAGCCDGGACCPGACCMTMTR